jgi:two-component system chemotaxis response regulator CheB
MVSSITEAGARETIAALEIGAVDFIPKQLSNNMMNVVNLKDDLVRKVKGLFGKKGKIEKMARSAATQNVLTKVIKAREDFSHLSHSSRRIRVVAIGTSTGGPMALQRVIASIPKEFPVGILIVQHMPAAFTGAFSDRLGQISQIQVREAKEGDKVQPGLAFVAPGGYHMRVYKRGIGDVEIRLSKDPPMLHMPSVDVMMTSVAEVYGDACIGVIMTGMGHDGQEGMKSIKMAKGKTLAQDEESCVVFGMPKAAIESGVVDKVVPLNQISGEIVNMV